ncbi:cell wall hydrolase [Sphingomonas sp. A2-49]|uniref:cell wall hydrolase n=1 Tax=Sphingomonas sp. A2-49 TaxID=1391375 RepID=UPI0021CEEC2E|nr:cell wall hydrolase [Sphingomonas sp. A2-49]MCU6453613.1 cell wall hydrolase [Sphingomonas sp. A2-49]
MGRLRISTIGQMVLGLSLLGASSCVPQRGGGARVAQAVPPPAPRQLLRELALDVPRDLPGLEGMPATLRASVADAAPTGYPAAAPPFVAQAQTDIDAARATDCLTAAVYYEARSEATEGQRAVAQVVLNRVRDRAFPHSVCGVVYQGSNRRTGCQFSFTCDGSMLRRRDPYAWARARSVAEAALAGEVYAPVGGATFYHTSAILPWWASSLTRIGSVGAHIFYRWRGAMDGALSFRAAYAGVEPGVGGSAGTGQGMVAYRDEMADGGVTVHRGTTAVVAEAAPAVAVVRGPRTTLFAGVRVHLGTEAPQRVVVDGATIGEESDPI